jgi:hypothetical protein
MALVSRVGTRRQISNAMLTTGFAGVVTIAPTYSHNTTGAVTCIANGTERNGFSHCDALGTHNVCDCCDQQAQGECSFQSRLHNDTHFFRE